MITETKPSLFNFFPHLSKNELSLSSSQLSRKIILEQLKMTIKKTCEIVALKRYLSYRDALIKTLAVAAHHEEDVKKILKEISEQEDSPSVSGTAAGILAMAEELESSKKLTI